jgi:hypothetical protein
MKTPAVKYAVYALVITIIWTMIEHFLGYNTTNHEVGQNTRLVATIIYYILVVVAIYKLKKQQGGMLSFGQGFKTGAGLSLIYSVGVSFWYALYGEVINTQFKPTLTAFERSKLEMAHAAPDIVAAKMKEVDMTTGGSFVSYIFLFVFMSLFGVIIAAIASLIMKRSKKV